MATINRINVKFELGDHGFSLKMGSAFLLQQLLSVFQTKKLGVFYKYFINANLTNFIFLVGKMLIFNIILLGEKTLNWMFRGNPKNNWGF
jgi:hypothetical protein